MSRDHEGRRSRGAAPHKLFIFWLPALLLSLYPLSTALAANLKWMPIPAGEIASIVAAAVLGTLVLLALLRRFDRGRGSTAIWLAATLLPLVAYGWLCDVVGVNNEDWRIAALYTSVSACLAMLFVQPWLPKSRDPIPLFIVGTVLLVVNGLSGFMALPSGTDEDRWHRAAEVLTRPPAAGRVTSTPTRDVYYIILDGFGSAEVMRQNYGVDLQPFVSFLHSRGFYVAERARSNYAQTFLSIASTLNFDYLDDLSAAMGTAGDRRPLARAIRQNALMTLARRSGYEVVAIGSNYAATMAFDAADRCACEPRGLSEFEQATLGSTPLAALPLGRFTTEAHRRQVLDSFGTLATAATGQRRVFVFAHIITPHPPFVFNADGSRRERTHELLGFRDGSHFPGSKDEYVSGYQAQTRFVAQRLTDLVTSLLDRPGPKPAIVIHGDHGPGGALDWDQPIQTAIDERMAIFSAYHLPDHGPALYQTMTPVNGARALATRYLGVTLPYLPDHSRFSTWDVPFHYVVPSVK